MAPASFKRSPSLAPNFTAGQAEAQQLTPGSHFREGIPRPTSIFTLKQLKPLSVYTYNKRLLQAMEAGHDQTSIDKSLPALFLLGSKVEGVSCCVSTGSVSVSIRPDV